MSVSTNVTTPVGSAISRAPCSRSTSSDAVAGRRAASGSRARRSTRSSRLASSGATPSHTIGSPGFGSFPVKSHATELASIPTSSAIDVAAALRSAAAPNTSTARPSAVIRTLGGTDVAVHDARPLRVEVVERRGDVGQPTEHGGDRQAGVAALGQQLGRGGAVDPVDDEHVAVVEQEVVPHGGHGGMGLEPEEEAPLLEQRRGIVAGGDPGDLQADRPFVTAVEAACHFGVAAGPEDLEHLVATADDLTHWCRVYEPLPNHAPVQCRCSRDTDVARERRSLARSRAR